MDGGKTLTITESVEHLGFPRTKDAIRMDIFKAAIYYEKGSDLFFKEYTHFDMGGYFPVKLLNMVMTSFMSKGIRDLYEKLSDI